MRWNELGSMVVCITLAVFVAVISPVQNFRPGQVAADEPLIVSQFDGGPANNGFMNGIGMGPPANDQNANPAAAGGGSMADFDSLMTLIQQTIDPDSWEALGGVGTMAPYPAGVMVDPSGLLRDMDSPDRKSKNQAATIVSLLTQREATADGVNDSTDWRSPARIRCVSIRRMMQALATRSLAKQSADTSVHRDVADESLEAFRAMAGLSRIAIVIVTEDDLILSGPVAGFEDRGGWQVDRKSGLPPMSLVSLAIGLKAARTNAPFGCTIDPTQHGLQSAAELGQRIVSGEVPMGMAAEQLAAALGRQDITVFGTTPSHEVAYVMVEADRHMKRLALGDEPMPDRVRNYLQLIPTIGDGSPPTDLLLRLWFTSQAMDARASEVDGDRIVQLVGSPIRLSGENERAMLDGARGNVVADATSQAFVDHFNQNWVGIRTEYPIYGALESIYMATAISEVWKRMAVSSDHETLQRAVMYFAAEQAEKLAAPQQVDSIAVLHRYRNGRKQHQVLMASGGVEIAPQSLLPLKMQDYPGLESYVALKNDRPTNRWWWNAKLTK
jgi:hypothetical protein